MDATPARMTIPPGLDLTQLVTLKEASTLGIGLNHSTLQGWQQRRLVQPVGTRRHPISGVLLHTYRLSSLVALQEKWLANIAATVPPGYVCGSDAATRLGMSSSHTRKLCRLGKLESIQLPASNTRESWFIRESSINIYLGRLAAEKAAGNRGYEYPAPAGYLSLRDLVARSGQSKNTLHGAIARNQLKAVKRTIRGIGVWIVTEAEALRFCGTVAPLKIAVVPPPIVNAEVNPIISPDDKLCLHARRELFAAKGRVFGNALASAKQAG